MSKHCEKCKGLKPEHVPYGPAVEEPICSCHKKPSYEELEAKVAELAEELAQEEMKSMALIADYVVLQEGIVIRGWCPDCCGSINQFGDCNKCRKTWRK
jgi:hypothetical protein